MPSIRLDKQIFPFFNSVKTGEVKAGESSTFNNNGFNIMKLEIGTSSNFPTIGVFGCVNILNEDGTEKTDDECSWFALSGIDRNFNIVSLINTNGLFSFSIDGLARVKITNIGSDLDGTIVGVAEV